MSTIDRMQRFSSGACRPREDNMGMGNCWIEGRTCSTSNSCSEEYEGSAGEAFPWVRHTRDFSQGDTVNWRTSSLGRNPKIFENGYDSWYTPDHQYNSKYNDKEKQGLSNKIRLSAQISNAPIILNVDCDMYSNYSESVRDAMCFFLDKEKGHEIAYIQFPQAFENLIENDIYSGSLRLIMEVDLRGFDSNGGPCYIGTGCFYRREFLSVKNTTRQVIKYYSNGKERMKIRELVQKISILL
ncbi:cellulose synthase-like protein E6 [Cannabis sativa]|uniref:cellulose synthase-like protein E6 n=1 Tax=Cannabis sativa TaxID=3483 RepID=UPI0029CA1015|nr:cellulose synthase-like protein E6 [Cannabis sativa]